MAMKFLICISLLIFARGGIPRFRFDYLTKLGWIRFFKPSFTIFFNWGVIIVTYLVFIYFVYWWFKFILFSIFFFIYKLSC